MIHDFKTRLEKAKGGLEESSISEKNKAAIRSFIIQCSADGLKEARLDKYLRTLRLIAERYCDTLNFEDMKKGEIVEIVSKIELEDKIGDWTKHDYKLALKKLLVFLGKNNEVSWIRTTYKGGNKLPDELLTEDEVMKMIEVSEHPRDKAFLAGLYESGCRISEIGNLKISDISFDNYGAVAIVSGKTGMRRVRLIFSAVYFASWLDIHPGRDNPKAPLWIGVGTVGKGEAMNYSAFRALLQRVAEKAKIKKKVNPHNFRHSRSTHLSKHLTEAQMDQYLGWVQGSKMPSVYVHLSGRDVDAALLKLQGEEIEEAKERTKLVKKNCVRCGTENAPTSKFCHRCGMALGLSTVIEQEEKNMQVMMQFFELIKEDTRVIDYMKTFLERTDRKVGERT
jgi:integrase/recombinase XerD